MLFIALFIEAPESNSLFNSQGKLLHRGLIKKKKERAKAVPGLECFLMQEMKFSMTLILSSFVLSYIKATYIYKH